MGTLVILAPEAWILNTMFYISFFKKAPAAQSVRQRAGDVQQSESWILLAPWFWASHGTLRFLGSVHLLNPLLLSLSWHGVDPASIFSNQHPQTGRYPKPCSCHIFYTINICPPKLMQGFKPQSLGVLELRKWMKRWSKCDVWVRPLGSASGCVTWDSQSSKVKDSEREKQGRMSCGMLPVWPGLGAVARQAEEFAHLTQGQW